MHQAALRHAGWLGVHSPVSRRCGAGQLARSIKFIDVATLLTVLGAPGASQKISLANANIQREKKTDAGRGPRSIVDRRRHVDRLRVVMGLPVFAPVAITMRFDLLSTSVLMFIAPALVSCERRPGGYAAHYRGDDKRHHDLSGCQPCILGWRYLLIFAPDRPIVFTARLTHVCDISTLTRLNSSLLCAGESSMDNPRTIGLIERENQHAFWRSAELATRLLS
jgi:hypothetical protein